MKDKLGNTLKENSKVIYALGGRQDYSLNTGKVFDMPNGRVIIESDSSGRIIKREPDQVVVIG